MSKRRRDWPDAPEPLPCGVIDNHTHLESIAGVLADGVGDPGVAGHLERAAEVGVEAIVQIGCDLDAARVSVEMAREHARVVAGVAIHPNEAVLHAGIHEVAPDGLEPAPLARHDVGLDDAIAEIARLAADPRVRTVGETGLDHFRAGPRGRAAQREAFRAHIALAKELDLPMQIHDREAHAEVLEVLEADGAPERTVFHCFSGDAEMARYCADRGYYLSFAGTLTFGNAHGLREAARLVPQELLLVETDAPYLTAHPWRGRPNAPYLLPLTVRALAQVREVELAELCAAITSTSEELYGPW
ncbi:TatD family deoxyribonuclease [Occultella glacieicola]|uniref:TatD family deoxyribonuclease n=1 Tax=Occultella glacieicola TaxID=2518684 RepID=A0ABY2E303_9MICO|nr:TatD family hydrolase [Occultella glacieicola]TDE93998.1 TatD family deoxyribonuclease [Occultella glacieicola]